MLHITCGKGNITVEDSVDLSLMGIELTRCGRDVTEGESIGALISQRTPCVCVLAQNSFSNDPRKFEGKRHKHYVLPSISNRFHPTNKAKKLVSRKLSDR